MWNLSPLQTQLARIAQEIEQACGQARTFGLSEGEVKEVLDNVRSIPEVLSAQIPGQVRWRALQRSLGDEWRFPLV